MNKQITWGHMKGKRGYWYWGRDGHLKFKAADKITTTRSITVIKDIEPFKNIAVDGKVIGGRRQKRDMMRAHGIEEAGDMKTPTKIGPQYDAKAHQRSVVESLKKSLHQHGMGD